MSESNKKSGNGRKVLNEERKLPPMQYSKPMPPVKPPKSDSSKSK